MVDDEVANDFEAGKWVDSQSKRAFANRRHRVEADIAWKDQSTIDADRCALVVDGTIPEGKRAVVGILDLPKGSEYTHVTW